MILNLSIVHISPQDWDVNDKIKISWRCWLQLSFLLKSKIFQKHLHLIFSTFFLQESDLNRRVKMRTQLCKVLEAIKFDEIAARRARDERKPKYRDFTNINGQQLQRRDKHIVVTIQYIMERFWFLCIEYNHRHSFPSFLQPFKVAC